VTIRFRFAHWNCSTQGRLARIIFLPPRRIPKPKLCCERVQPLSKPLKIKVGVRLVPAMQTIEALMCHTRAQLVASSPDAMVVGSSGSTSSFTTSGKVDRSQPVVTQRFGFCYVCKRGHCCVLKYGLFPVSNKPGREASTTEREELHATSNRMRIELNRLEINWIEHNTGNGLSND
jgi:hypothetical protein